MERNIIYYILILLLIIIYVYHYKKHNLNGNIYTWEKKRIIESNYYCNTTIKTFPFYNFTMYIRNGNDYLSNILRRGIIYKDCIKLYNIWFNTYPNRRSIYVDAGANIGTCSLFLMNFGVKTIAFEPILENLNLFTRSLLHNKFMLNLITLYRIGLGSCKENKIVYCFNNNLGASSIVNHKNNSFKSNIHIDRLDKFISIDTKIHLLKVDVEGYELEVLKGSEKLLKKKNIDYIFVEINCFTLKINPTRIYDFLESYNYIANNKYYCDKKLISGNVLFFRKDISNPSIESIINSIY